jgi:3-keto-5-aminohexanoate cleavage enzyme
MSTPQSETVNAPVMIMVAPNGAYAGRADNPATPISPQEISDEVIRCAQAGASIAHLHARDTEGRPTQSLAVFREIVERIREKSDIVIQISLGTPGFTVDQALEPVVLKPEMVSLPLVAFMNGDARAQGLVRQMAERIRDAGVRPELSVYSDAMLQGALGLIEAGAVLSPAAFGLIMKDPASMRAGAGHLMGLAEALPAHAQWFFAKGGKYGLGLRSLAIELGGHVRVGFEDSVRDFGETRLAPGNAYLVERIATLCAALGRPVATAKEARAAVGVGAA